MEARAGAVIPFSVLRKILDKEHIDWFEWYSYLFGKPIPKKR